MLLLLSIIALFLGPMIYRVVERNPKLMGALDAFIFVVIGGVVLFHILPDIFVVGGPWALAFLLIGLALPAVVEHTFHKVARHAHAGALLFAAIGLGLHGMTDGAALADAAHHDHQSFLALGVILHRLPVGLTIWWLLRPHFGAATAFIVLVGISLSTIAGHSIAGHFLEHLHGPAMAWFEALVVGTILHVVFHRPYHEDHAHQEATVDACETPEVKTNWLQGIGSLIGIATLLAIMMPYWLGTLSHQHGHHHDADELVSGAVEVSHSSAEVLHRLLELSLAAAPWLLLAYVVATAINFLMPHPFALPQKQDGSENPIKQALKGSIAGLPLPICVPNASRLYNQLVKNGAGQTYALAFLMASPLLGIDALLLTWGLLGHEWALWRLCVTFIFSLLIALSLGYWLKKASTNMAAIAAEPTQANWRYRMQQAVRHGYAHLIDHTAPWVIAGLVIASILPAISGLNELPVLTTIVVLATLSLPFHICATGMTPLLAVLLVSGLPPSFALILLLLGPVTNLTLMKLLSKLHGKTSARLITASMVAVALLLSQFIPYWPATELSFASDHHGDHSWQYLALIAVILLYSISLLRRGARAFVGELLPTASHAHSHKHHH